MTRDSVSLHTAVLDSDVIEVLERLGEQPELRHFYLAGGTAAALQIGHRKSIDLGLFTERPWSFDRVRHALAAVGDVVVDRAEPGTLVGTVAGVRTSLFHYVAPLIEEPLATPFAIPLASLLDIGCMKLIAVLQRGSRKDFIDLYHLGEHGIPIATIVAALPRKFPGVSYNPVHIARSLAYFEDAEAEPEPVMLVPYAWEQVRRYALDASQALLDRIVLD